MEIIKAKCKTQHKVLHVVGWGNPKQKIQAEKGMGWEQQWEEGLWGVDWQEACHEPAMCTHSPERKKWAGLHPKSCGQQVKGGDSALCSTLVRPIWSPVSSSRTFSIKRTWSWWSEPRGVPFLWRQAEITGNVQHGGEKALRTTPIAPKGSYKKAGEVLLIRVCRN